MAIHFEVFRRHYLSIVAAVLMAIMASLPSQSYAGSPEQRCTELGANCSCSEPLNTTTYTLIPATSHAYNAGDSTVKQCKLGQRAGMMIGRNKFDFTGTNEATIMAALPAVHTNTHVLRGPEAHTGIWDMGSHFGAGDSAARRAVRWYLYFSPNFAFTIGNPACSNSGKLMAVNHEGPIMTFNGRWGLYAWVGWNIAPFDCCIIGPGSDAEAQAALVPANIKGKWHRLEAVLTNVGLARTVIRVYWKNITDNGPEYKIVDTSIPTTQPYAQNWTSIQATTLTRPVFTHGPYLNAYRSGTCPGFFAWSHILYAAWGTDDGQRIGAAYEIEGRTTRPAPPGSVTVR